jgi:hypothetical protein
MRKVIPLILGVFFAAGCAAELDLTEDGELIRGPLGKVDAVGTCGEVCDGPAPLGNCWCDPDCLAFGDCCEDRADFCPVSADRTCGGPQDLPCASDEYCHFELESDSCGPVGALGTCVAKPDVCLEVFEPVCGCDGETYGNACKAHALGVNVAAHTTCDPTNEI